LFALEDAERAIPTPGENRKRGKRKREEGGKEDRKAVDRAWYCGQLVLSFSLLARPVA